MDVSVGFSSIAKMLVCVHSFEYDEPCGEVISPYLKKPCPFTGVVDLVNRMDAFFDHCGFPQAYNQYRTFRTEKAKSLPRQKSNRNIREAVKYMDDSVFETNMGDKATFVVQVQFRQNSTWQGSITWTEQKKTQHFRSTLEMIKLMDSALAAAQENRKSLDWD